MPHTAIDSKEGAHTQTHSSVPIVRGLDMSESMKEDAFRVAQEAMRANTTEMDISKHIKKTFDDLHGPQWHCVVGRKFGSYVTHERGSFIYFLTNNTAILLFKAQSR